MAVNILIFLTFLTGLFLIRKIKESFLYIVFAIITYAFVNEAAAWYYHHYINRVNIAFYCIYALLSLILFLWVLKKLLNQRKYDLLINSFIIIYVIAWIIETVFFTKFKNYSPNAMAVGSIFIIIGCLLTIRSILYDDTILDIRYDSKFWFITGTLFFYFFLLTYIFINTLGTTGISDALIRLNKRLLTIANFIFYPFTIIAFLCQLKKNK